MVDSDTATNVVAAVMVILVVIMFGLVGYTVAQRACQAAHRNAVFQEQVAKHNCKLQKVWEDGVLKEGKTCVLPDGTILQRGN
jgi:CHASE1-domain containing sensor protein